MAAITKTDVVGWLRVQARKHRKAAEVLEGAADEVERAELGEQGEQKADTLHEGYDIGIESPNSGPSVADVRKYLGNGSKRKPEIAANFGVADIALDDILTEENGFRRGERGWWTVITQNGEHNLL